ncbi:hypothetical protein DW322_04520 [Rhodococcus rhodnii]|uniref:Uncharacterized protein n=2 Tax=Rhodococcus rhodnii TaxID=38312 RepID=R7WGR7_9NOCA|nr:hypothetical protein [Rhodococcus rhodnii]EOM74221.1 hypothetical protein Rrhod_4364 [Rhodococcus rhodnii LMG 5362]TXG89623.1 hypothetical protein DW322_04520 [Rhodococcus rhodnii]
MVLPLIPAALIAVGALTGGGGLTLGGKAALDMKRAADQKREAEEQYRKRYGEIEECVEAVNARISMLGEQQERALAAVVFRFIDFMKRNEKKVAASERLVADGVETNQRQITEAEKLALDAFSWLGGVLGSTAAVSGASAAVLGTAGAVGAASTGTAISGLSGVAATNATMAWLGGGALSAGGGGMALGGLALNFVTIGPALLIGGVAATAQASKLATQSKKAQADAAVAIAELDEHEVRLDAVRARADELQELLERLALDGVRALDILESEEFDPVRHTARMQRAFQLSKAVADVAKVPVLDADGELAPEGYEVTIKYKAMSEENHG